MPLGRPGPFAEKLRVVAACLAVGMVSWQALASISDVASELGKPVEQHLRVLRASPEELVRSKLGADYAILEALRSRVPRDARVLVSFANERSAWRELRRRSTWLGSLVYPMLLDGWPFDAEHASSVPAKKDWSPYVLDLESGRDFSAWSCEELARGPGYRLFRALGEPR